MGTPQAQSIRDQVQAFAVSVAREFGPERIILFGSRARGDAGPDSDADILVVMDFDGHPAWRAWEILKRVPRSFPLDLLVRTPADLAARYAQLDPIAREAVDRGIVLYQRARAA